MPYILLKYHRQVPPSARSYFFSGRA